MTHLDDWAATQPVRSGVRQGFVPFVRPSYPTKSEALDMAYAVLEQRAVARYRTRVLDEKLAASRFLSELLDAAYARYGWSRKCTAQVGPIWKLGGEVCGCTLSAGHTERVHICSCGSWWTDKPNTAPDATAGATS